MEIKDQFGRSFKTLRISLTSACNLACYYCIDSKKLKVIRLTGGEPLLYKDRLVLVGELNKIGISNIKLTTNGVFLERMAIPLHLAGITSMMSLWMLSMSKLFFCFTVE